jgi:phosphatidylserine/phosphatidylglycerophosphate/cardiolipin synthase-like enzyme
MKNAIIDGRSVFLGSMNLDQRSAMLNTELGLIIDSPEMASQLASFADAGSSYRLRLRTGDGAIEWLKAVPGGAPVVYDVPPETTVLQRLWLHLTGPLIPEKDL